METSWHKCINDNKEIDRNNFQMKHCILYYNNLVNAYNPIIQARKGLILYYKTNGIINFSNHVNENISLLQFFWRRKSITQKNKSKVTNKTKA
jgi:hypothetical protein